MIQYFQPKCIPESAAPFTQVVVDDHYAHLAGLVAADFPEGQAVLGDVAAETDEILKRIQLVLGELGLSMRHLVRTDVHLKTLDDFDQMDAAYRRHFEAGRYPARTTTQSRQLFGDSRVEITCMAAIGELDQ